MEGNEAPICRLCLKVCEKGYEPIEGAVLEMLNCVLLNLALRISDEPVACDSCVGNLKRCVNFKKDCLRLRDQTFVSNNDKNNVLDEPKVCPSEDINTADMNMEVLPGSSTEDEDKVPSVLKIEASDNMNINCSNMPNISTVGSFYTKVALCKSLMFMKTEPKAYPSEEINTADSDIVVLSDSSIEDEDKVPSVLKINASDDVNKNCSTKTPNIDTVRSFCTKFAPCKSLMFMKTEPKACPSEAINATDLDIEVLSDCSAEGENNVPSVLKTDTSDDININCNTNIPIVSSSVCSFCTKVAACKSLMFMKTDYVDMMSKLEKFFPELALDDNKDPMVCTSCDESLQHYFTFINGCLNTEEKIKDYCEIAGTNSKGQIELREVLHFTLRDTKITTGCNNLNRNAVKEESCEQSREQNGCRSEVKNEHIQEQELDLNDDEMDIKMEENNVERFPDNVTQLSETEQTPSDLKVPENTTYKCQLCRFETNHPKKLKKHSLIHKLPTYTCDVCGFKTKHMASHMLTHLDLPMHKCKVCSFKTKYKGGLSRHMLTHKSTSEVTMYECDVCSYQSKHKDDLQKHVRIHKSSSETHMYRCKLCTFQSKHSRSLKLHSVMHKSDSEVTLYGCKVCSFKTKHRQNLSRHIQSHKSDAEIQWLKCDICGHKTKRKTSLIKHMHTHATTPDKKL